MKAIHQKDRKSFKIEERASEEVARGVFEYLFEDKQVIKSCAQLLADSILIAHQLGDQCWSLTLFTNQIRLNVGPVEVLVLLYDEIFMILEGSEIADLRKGELDSFISAPEVFYPSVPVEQVFCHLPSQRLDDLYPRISERHQAFIQMAAKRRKKSSWGASFSPGVIAYLNKLLGITLPTPSYFSGIPEPENLFPNEVAVSQAFREGSASKVLVNVYERDDEARRSCIKHYGVSCQACGFNFEEFYGELGAEFIHVHHLKPLSEIGEEYDVDPIVDLLPVCPNCHAMIHRYGLISVEELESLINLAAQGKPKMA
ncbi:MAG: HNH endonuclease [Acidobacteriota bacterium]|nr:HNH endonuclease [Acidobacteriota bacterium]